MICMHRPAIVETPERINQECASARWTYHRLLDFEAEHQRVLDSVADQIAPGIVRVGRILARLARRTRRAEHTTKGQWAPNPRPDLAASLRVRLGEMRAVRNADPRWKVALGWADEPVGDPKAVRRRRAKPAEKIRRRKTETDEAFAKRFELLTQDETDEHYAAKLSAAPRDSRRDVYRKKLYEQRRIYWGTWNALVRSVDQARKDVIGQRARGMPAEIRRPKYRDPISLSADTGGFRIIERGKSWWTIEFRVGTTDEWVRLRAKCGNWHEVFPNTPLRSLTLTRRKDGERWSYSISIVVDMQKPVGEQAQSRVVAFDWGHREHGHERAREGIRVFTWLGDDGESGEVLIPTECRTALDEIDALKSRMDKAYDGRKSTLGLSERNRYLYRRSLMRSGVRTVEETDWLRWEMRYERRIAARRKRIVNLRREVYLIAVRELRARYAIFAFEDESVPQIKEKQKDEERKRRQRSNRDLAARYEFTSICERSGATILSVPARNTTKECPDCGQLVENGPELLVACPGCGRVRDKDRGASRVILGRAKEALANRAA
jgi:transposase